MRPELIGVLLYVLIQFAIGLWVSRRIRSREDYLLAGRSLGPLLASFSIFATWFGAETCIGSSSEIHQHGLSGGRADPFGYAICLLLMGLLLARPLWRRGIVTLGDLYRERFSRTVERVAVLVLIPTSLLWAAAQMQAFAAILGSVAGVSTDATLALGAALVIAYTTLGGLKADIITDLVQGIALILGLGALLFVALSAAGGVVDVVRAVEPQRWSLGGEGESLLARLDTWAIPIVGSLVAQELIARMLACRSAGVARGATLAGAGIYLVVGCIPVLLALAGPSLVGPLDDPEQFLPEVARQHLPIFLYVLFAGALVSAILSTVDSALLAVGSFVSQNLVPRRYLEGSERRELRVARGTVILAGITAYFLARHGGSIYDLVETASSFGSAGIVVITGFGLWTRFGGPRAAIAALVAGVAANPIAEARGLEAPYLTTIAVAFTAFLLVGVLERARSSRSTRSGIERGSPLDACPGLSTSGP
ncbi:MAG: sodium:solute symporter family protein [Planctomycetota bacterium]